MVHPIGIDPAYDLTDNEKRVAQMFCQGLCNKEVAFQMGVSTATVHQYTRGLRAKLRCNSIQQMIVKLFEEEIERTKRELIT